MSSGNQTGSASERTQLIAEIERAFAARPLPARTTDCDPDCPECNAITADFYGRQWEEIDDAKIAANRSMSFFTPNAFRYFLPAYLRYSLKHFNLDSDVCEFTVYGLTPSMGSEDAAKTAWLREQLICFDRKQAEIVVRFLMLVSQDEELSGFHYNIEETITSLKGLLHDLKLWD